MILIDTNVIVQTLIVHETERAILMQGRARKLLLQIEQGVTNAVIPEVVLHECYYVLMMRMKLFEPSTFTKIFRSLLAFPGWKMERSEISIYLRALDFLETHPKLEFSDAVIAARAEAHNAELATFDNQLADAYSGPRWSAS